METSPLLQTRKDTFYYQLFLCIGFSFFTACLIYSVVLFGVTTQGFTQVLACSVLSVVAVAFAGYTVHCWRRVCTAFPVC